MIPSTTEPTPPRAQLRDYRDRKEHLEQDRRRLIAELPGVRDELGQAIATGADAGRIRAHLEHVSTSLQETADAIAFLDRALAELAVEAAKEEFARARAACRQHQDAEIACILAMPRVLGEYARTHVVPAWAAYTRLSTQARAAEGEFDRAAQAAKEPHDWQANRLRADREGWGRTPPGLRDVVQALLRIVGERGAEP